MVAAPAVEDTHGLDHTEYAGWIFALPLLLSALCEAPITLWCDKRDRRRLLGWGLLGLGLALGLCAVASRAWLLSFGLAIAGAGSGISCSLAQAELVARSGGHAERAMSRWEIFAAIGDLLAPAFVSISALWVGYRGAFATLAAVLVLTAVPLLTKHGAPAPEQVDEPEAHEPIRNALQKPRLWWYLTCAAACTLLDELVVALVSLRLARDVQLSAALVTVCLTSLSAGSVIGAFATDSLVARCRTSTVLWLSSIAASSALILVAVCERPWLLLGSLVLLGLGAAPHYALAKAAAYDLVPSRPGLVNALAQLFVIFDLGLPLLVGAIAERYGLTCAFAALGVQPVLMIALALTWRSSRSASDDL